MKKSKESIPTTKNTERTNSEITEEVLVKTIKDLYGKHGEKVVGRKK